jgi:hypothetical protein
MMNDWLTVRAKYLCVRCCYVSLVIPEIIVCSIPVNHPVRPRMSWWLKAKHPQAIRLDVLESMSERAYTSTP